MASMTDVPRHPAQFSGRVIETMAPMLAGTTRIVDPFAGKGGIFKLHAYYPQLEIQAVEIQPKWAAADPRITVGSALALPWPDDYFDGAATSPTYANRMADHHEAKDGSRRNTYRHAYGEPLHADNSGTMQWGERYQRFHARAWMELRRCLRQDSVFVLNIKDHIRDGQRVRVTAWHTKCLVYLGFELVELGIAWGTGLRQGANHNLRVPEGESVLKFVLRTKVSALPSEDEIITFCKV